MSLKQNLIPSPLRTTTLQASAGVVVPVMWSPKSSADCLDYTLDFSGLLAGTGDTLASVQSTRVITDQGTDYELKIMWSAVTGPLVVAFLVSGRPGSQQKLLFEIGTTQGRVYCVAVVLQITTLTPATAPPSDFPSDTLTNGGVLIAGIKPLPSGYASNGGAVVMAGAATTPSGYASNGGLIVSIQ